MPREWVQNKKIKPAQFATLVYLLGHRNAKTKVCRPSVATLAKLTGTSPATVHRHLAHFTRLGLIARVQQGENRAAQTWFAHLDAKEFAAAVAGKPVRFRDVAEPADLGEHGEPDVDVAAEISVTEVAEAVGSHDEAPAIADSDVPPITDTELAADAGFDGFRREYEMERVAA